ncbi:vomeronasal type-1 receptor 52-like [Arvicanthis niloticus]|uniref:vomeronasal type-1 receptor 52-like n=1 Tax=Arvicanthis niloticus TaxID=61156 RepID=UPI001485D7E5|nr:vomeronasal type-1 receptor 52-like [Arvicanthis niloticus]
MNKDHTRYCSAYIRNAFFSEIGIGISANSCLLLFHTFMFIRKHRPRLTDLPIGLMALIHLVMLLLAAYISEDFFVSSGGWDDITCKLFIFFHRFFRNLSVCATCLLSVFQAIILCPQSSYLAKFKHNSPHQLSCFFILLSIFYTSISSHILIAATATQNLTSVNLIYITKSCSFTPMSSSMQHTFSTMLVFRNVFLIVLMSLSTFYMATLLCRHKTRSQHLQNSSISPKASPEQRALQTILMLLSFFLVMSTFDSILSSSRTIFQENPTLYCIQILVAHSYASVSPLLLLSNEKRVTNLLISMYQRIVIFECL